MTAETKHTPGPWAVRPHWSDDSKLEVFPTRPDQDCTVGAWAEIAEVSEGGDGETAEANARLIAAAPDLLEACKRAEEFIRNGIELGFIRMPNAGTLDPAHDTPGIIDAALAKAEGRS